MRARAGDVVDAPRNVRHTYRCVGDGPGTLLFLTWPSGIEDFFERASKLGSPPDLDELAEAGTAVGLAFELPPPEASEKRD